VANADAERRGVSVTTRVTAEHPDDPIILATHGNLLALILRHFDRSVDSDFWRLLSMPDIYRLAIRTGSPPTIERVWS
jgi:2,3-bisphosphoglycerate-dependent phosphoglycerate mutase